MLYFRSHNYKCSVDLFSSGPLTNKIVLSIERPMLFSSSLISSSCRHSRNTFICYIVSSWKIAQYWCLNKIDWLICVTFMDGYRAAYKGFADSIRLLLFLDAYRGRQDKEGEFHSSFIFLSRELYYWKWDGAILFQNWL